MISEYSEGAISSSSRIPANQRRESLSQRRRTVCVRCHSRKSDSSEGGEPAAAVTGGGKAPVSLSSCSLFLLSPFALPSPAHPHTGDPFLVRETRATGRKGENATQTARERERERGSERQKASEQSKSCLSCVTMRTATGSKLWCKQLTPPVGIVSVCDAACQVRAAREGLPAADCLISGNLSSLPCSSTGLLSLSPRNLVSSFFHGRMSHAHSDTGCLCGRSHASRRLLL